MKRPPFTSSTTLAAGTEDFGVGEAVTGYRRGDFILARADNRNQRIIRFGQRLRIHGPDEVFATWSHAALIVSDDGQLVEAVGKGVQESHLDRYHDIETRLCRITAADLDRDQAVDFARWALRERSQYGRFTIVSILMTMLTGSKFAFFVDGEHICSGLVARALERTGAIFSRDPGHMAPADLAKYYAPGTGSA